MNSDFRAPVDIANRALQHCGARQITTMTDSNDRATEVRFCYDKLRASELRRNVWAFATRKTMLRPVDTTMMLVTFPSFDTAKAYPKFHPAVDATTGRSYQAQIAVAAASTISDSTAGSIWTRYFGVDVARPYDATESYAQGELVYGTTGIVFMALVDDPDDDPTAAAKAYSATTTYRKGDTVTSAAVEYQSIANLNLNSLPPSANWVTTASVSATQVGKRVGQQWLRLGSTTLEALEIAYPLGSGPSSETSTRNIFRLPQGYLREAPQSPKAGSTSFLGAPAGLDYTDYEYENGYITSSTIVGIVYRYVADVSDVLTFDPMFCDGLAARIGMEVCERLTQNDTKVSTVASMYGKFMSEARIVNAIETGSTEPPMDDYIAARF